MKIINLWKLEDLKHKHPSTRAACNNWEQVTREARWNKFEEIRNSFNSADRHKEYYIFNLGKQYRLIAIINFATEELLIRGILDHDKYARGEWNK